MAALDGRSSPFTFGAGYVEQATGVRFEVHHPQERPDLWKRYLDGGEARYSKHGIKPVLGRSLIEHGTGVSMFFVGIDRAGEVVAGVRVHGPLSATSSCQALAEMSSSSEIDVLASTVESNLPYGVIELKGAWGALGSGGLHAMGSALARCTSHSLSWLRAELALGTIAVRLQSTAEKTGAEQIGLESVPYPSERFRTVLVGWHRSLVMQLADPVQADLLRYEADQLLGAAVSSFGTEGAGAPRRVATGWSPIILDSRERVDRQVIEQARRDAGLRVVDHLAAQRDQLAHLLPPAPSELTEEAPRHVLYPWRNTLVVTLGPKGYERLRLDRNRNRITQAEQLELRSKKLGVVGLSVGHSIAHVLAMEGICGELRLADFDEIELSNLNRIPASLVDIGTNKAVVAARRIAEIDPYLDVKVLTEGVTPENIETFVDGLDVIIDECDSLAVKVLLREVARAKGIPVLMETSDRGLLDVERFDLEPDRPLFHGLLGDLTSADVAAMPPGQHVALVLRIVDASQASARGAASLAEVGVSLSTWPQLGGDVTLGAASMAAAVRRLGRGEPLGSGRVRVDLEQALGEVTAPSPPLEIADEPDGTSYRVMPMDPIRAVVHAASLAPSGANCQPWRFEVAGDQLRIYLDPTKSKTMDVAFRGSYVALGAALFNARVTAAARGILGDHVLFPEGEEADKPVAVLKLSGRSDPEIASWYQDVIARSTNRQHGTPAALAESTRAALAVAAEKEGAILHLIDDRATMDQLGAVLAESERLRFLTPTLHEEMLSELVWPGRDDLDTGIDVRTLELGPMEMGVLGVATRGDVMQYLADWGAGHMLGMAATVSVATSSALAIVTTRGHSPVDYVEGGMAVERVWVAAQREGLGVSPLSPVFLYATDEPAYEELVGPRQATRALELDSQFRSLIGAEGDESMLLVLRLSTSPPPSFLSRRLPLDEVSSGLAPSQGLSGHRDDR